MIYNINSSKNVYVSVVVIPYNNVGYMQITNGRGHNDMRERRECTDNPHFLQKKTHQTMVQIGFT